MYGQEHLISKPSVHGNRVSYNIPFDRRPYVHTCSHILFVSPHYICQLCYNATFCVSVIFY